MSKSTESLYTAIAAWQQDKATDSQLNVIYGHLKSYCNGLIAQRAYALHLMSVGIISEGDVWIHFSKNIKKYDRTKACFNTWAYNQVRTLIRNYTRREIRYAEKKELNNKAGEWLDTNFKNGKQEFNYEHFDNALDDKELDRLYNTL